MKSKVIITILLLSVVSFVQRVESQAVENRAGLVTTALDFHSYLQSRKKPVQVDPQTAAYFAPHVPVNQRTAELNQYASEQERRSKYLRRVLTAPRKTSAPRYQRQRIDTDTVSEALDEAQIKGMTRRQRLAYAASKALGKTNKVIYLPGNEEGESIRLPRGHVKASYGYRHDEIDWNIAGNTAGAGPTVLAEYIWPDVEMWQNKVDAGVVLKNKYVLDGSFAYSSTFDGNNAVSEYDGDNRTDKAVEIQTTADHGEAYDGSLGVGVLVDLKRRKRFEELDTLYMKMIGGYSYHTQKLSMQNGVQTFDSLGGSLGPFDGLDSTYDMEWQGPWMGVEFTGEKQRLTSTASLKYHMFDYYGEGDLNLQPAFAHPKSFDHDSDGRGVSVDLGVGYKLTPSWDVNVMWSLRDWKIDEGIDRLYLADQTSRDTRLNEVNLLSHSFMVGSKYDF